MVQKNHYKVFILFLLYFFIIDSLEIVLPLHFKEIGMATSLIGLIFSLANILRFICTITFLQKDIHEVVNVLIVFLLILTGLITYILLENIWILLIIFSTKSTFNITLNPFIMRLTPIDSRGKIMGIRDIFLYVGSTLGIAISSFISINSFKKLYILFILISLIAILVNMKIEYDMEGKSENSLSKNNYKKNSIPIYPMNKTFISFILYSFLASISGGYLFLLPIIGKSLNISNSHILGSFALTIAIASVFSLLGGIISDRYNNRLILICQAIFMIIIGYIFLNANTNVFYSIGVLFTSFLYIFSVTFSVYFFNSYTDEEGEYYWKKMIPVTLIADSIAPLFWAILWSKFGNTFSSFSLIIINIIIILIIIIMLKDDKEVCNNETI
ncbi:MFS transporter [Mammaliicoccus sciuri]|uniref:MFS transporter n=1 Tax=Mammaliicoccus sciuri TaxID=1296 RepID=UPI001FB29BA1|nr:MFS transporter [Mammaliicoccus sciuri]MCJ0925274.1 MFS transporter [Mammaliicoccus sciuri]